MKLKSFVFLKKNWYKVIKFEYSNNKVLQKFAFYYIRFWLK